MEGFITVTHIIVAVILIALVLLQDSKSGSVGGAFGGGTSSSILGATGAATLAQKMTRYIALIFAVTSIMLSVFATKTHKSVIDSAVIETSATPAAPAADTTQAAPATTGTAAPETPQAAEPKK